MKQLTILALLLLTACAPQLEPDAAPAAGVTVTVASHAAYTTYTVTTETPLAGLYLRFQGEGLRANAPECTATPTALECVIEPLQAAYEVSIAGVVVNNPGVPLGLACVSRSECGPIYLPQ